MDKQGTINLIDASKSSGVAHFVLVSSLLTNGADCKQTDNANYKVLQAFGGVLASKREAEVYLQKSGTLTSAHVDLHTLIARVYEVLAPLRMQVWISLWFVRVA